MIQTRTQTRTQKKTQTKIQTKTQKKRQTKTQTRTQMRKRTKTKGRRLKEEERRSRCRHIERTRFLLFSLRSSWDSTSSCPLLLITPASRNQCSVTRSKKVLNIKIFHQKCQPIVQILQVFPCNNNATISFTATLKARRDLIISNVVIKVSFQYLKQFLLTHS